MGASQRTMSLSGQREAKSESRERGDEVRAHMVSMRRLNPLAAVADQAWLSLLSFTISLAFIWGASKSEYGYYLLLVAPLMLVQSIQNAIVNSPLATFLPAADEKAKPALRRTAVSLHIYLAFSAAVLGGVGLAAYEHWTGLKVDILLLAGFSFAIVGTIAREAQRSFAYVQGQGIRALAGDLAYGTALMAGIAWAILSDQLTAGIVLMLTGLAGVLPLWQSCDLSETADSPRVHASILVRALGLAILVVTWANLSAYPYLPTRLDWMLWRISAARLFLMPVGLA